MKWLLILSLSVVALACNGMGDKEPDDDNSKPPNGSGGIYLTNAAAWNSAKAKLGDRQAGQADGSWLGGNLEGSSSLSTSVATSRSRLYKALAANAEIKAAAQHPQDLLPAVLRGSLKVYAAKEGGKIKTIVEVTKPVATIAAAVRKLESRHGSGGGGGEATLYDRLLIGLIDAAPRKSQGKFEQGKRRPGSDGFRKALETSLGTKVTTVSTRDTERKDIQRLREYLYETIDEELALRAAITSVDVSTPEIEGDKHLKLEKMVINKIEVENYPDPRQDIEFAPGDWRETTDVDVGIQYIVDEGTARSMSTSSGFVVTKGESPITATLHLLSTEIGDEDGMGEPVIVNLQLGLIEKGTYYGDAQVGDAAVSMTLKWELDGEYIYLFEVKDYEGHVPAAMAEFEKAVYRVAEFEGERTEYFLRDPNSNLVAKVYGFRGGGGGFRMSLSFFLYSDLKTVSARYVTVPAEAKKAGSFAAIDEMLVEIFQKRNEFKLDSDDSKRLLRALEDFGPKDMTKAGDRSGKYVVEVPVAGGGNPSVFAIFTHSDGSISVLVTDNARGWSGTKVMSEFER